MGYTDQQKKPLEVDGELGERDCIRYYTVPEKQEMQIINYGTVAGLTWKLLHNILYRIYFFAWMFSFPCVYDHVNKIITRRERYAAGLKHKYLH